MKRVFALILALALVFSLSMTAFAEDGVTYPVGEGSITITNATIGQKYNVYKLFDASVSEDNEGISYKIDENNQFFAVLFGSDGTQDNPYFSYDPDYGDVAKKSNVDNGEVIAYLRTILGAEPDENGSYVPTHNYDTAAPEQVAASDTVKFDNLPFGYYMVTSNMGAAVTITSTTPDAEVIDKNQKPAGDFKKEVAAAYSTDGEPSDWQKENTANIGDKITYKVSFKATNYGGDERIQYYQIHDVKGDGLSIDFSSFKVTVGGDPLDKGYYLTLDSTLPAPEKPQIGNWTGDRDDAQWYVVHKSANEFRVTIPWLEDHWITDVRSTDGVASFKVNYNENAAFLYTSPSDVEITYCGAANYNATIGGGTNTNLLNTAEASWTFEGDTGTVYSTEDTVHTNIYGIGVLKDDEHDRTKNLKDAKFELYKSYNSETNECSGMVNVIPTTVQGVYIIDSEDTYGAGINGNTPNTARAVYADKLEDYLGTAEQKGEVITQVNGKLVILGLEKGTYYLKETKAPNGYNSLSKPVEIKVGEGVTGFSIFADANGVVADIQQAEGGYSRVIYQVTNANIHNSRGRELPSTGGEGTMMMITIGTMVALCFAVLLITHKKMSVYKDF